MKKTKKKNRNVANLSGKRKRLVGVVVRNRADKTVAVNVSTKMRHPLYRKVLKKVKKYMAHTDKKLSIGDKVIIEQSRPISKRKKWRVLEKIGQK